MLLLEDVHYSRRTTTGTAQSWPVERRRRHLAREEVEIPISLDASVFPLADAGGADDCLALLGVDVPEDGGGGLPSLETRLKQTPGVPPGPRSFVGYDICDEADLSLLMNCALPGNSTLRRFLQLSVNRYHLLYELANASACRLLFEQLVPEHAPLRVVALWLALDSQRF